jgi:hypothetical protein
VYATIGA